MRDITYFLGASGPAGYVSLFGNAYNPASGGRYYLLKGGPGTGKSTFMRRAAQQIKREGYDVRYVTCSADPDSLDAVIFPELNSGIFDATAPHVMEPRLPGVCEQIINLGDCWDTELLRKNAAAVTALTKENSDCHKKAADFLAVASRFAAENARLAWRCINREKLDKYIKRLCLREIKDTLERTPVNIRCLLSGITPYGVVMHADTVRTLAQRIIAVEDESGAVAPHIVSAVYEYALSRGYDAVLCMCPLSPEKKTEHVIIPQLGLCVFTSNSYHSSPAPGVRLTHAGRFLNTEAMQTQREHTEFNRKAKEELINEAVLKLKKAKSVHDKLESLYAHAMDFEAVDALCARTVKEILSLQQSPQGN